MTPAQLVVARTWERLAALYGDGPAFQQAAVELHGTPRVFTKPKRPGMLSVTPVDVARAVREAHRCGLLERPLPHFEIHGDRLRTFDVPAVPTPLDPFGVTGR